MIRRVLFVASCALAAIAVAAAQVASMPPAQAEQIETGFGRLPGHSRIAYSIRLLPVSSFPQLPLPVAQQLDRTGCMIPQTYEAREPENVISGSFEKQGSADWAALCSVKGITTLYVFFQSEPAKPIALRRQPDSEWLGTEWSQDYGSAWGISTLPSRVMPRTDHAGHDGIQDSFVGQSNTVHYFQNSHWTTLDSTQ